MLKKLIYLSFVTIVSLALLEVSIRAALPFSKNLSFFITQNPSAEEQSKLSNLEQYLETRSLHSVPHRAWFNFWNNKLGFNDKEFEESADLKDSIRLTSNKIIDKDDAKNLHSAATVSSDVTLNATNKRILALGDSFIYGLVPYSDNVITVLEDKLKTACGDNKLEIYNLGIAASSVRDYRLMYNFVAKRYPHKVVLLHFYLGNDGYDLINQTSEISPRKPKLYLKKLLINIYKFFSNKNSLTSQAKNSTLSKAPHGGDKIDPNVLITDDSPVISVPTFNENFFLKIMIGELGQHLVPRSADEKKISEEGWQEILQEILEVKNAAKAHGAELVVVLYPSQIQVYPQRVAKLIEDLKNPSITNFLIENSFSVTEDTRFDLSFANKTILDFCHSQSILCIDTTASLQASAQKSPKSIYKTRDTHWNILGNNLAAEAEYGLLKGLDICNKLSVEKVSAGVSP